MNMLPKVIRQALKKQGERTLPIFQTQLYYHLGLDQGVENFINGFSQLQTNHERVDYLHESLRKYNLLDDKFVRDAKNDDKATKLKEKGNRFFAKEKFGTALRCYTKTLMRASDPELIAIAYANRSAALFKLRLYDECLTDIERALAAGYPAHLKPKLVQRRAKASDLQKKARPAPKAYEEPPKIPLHQRNPAVNCASACIEVKVDAKQRRRVFATRDIEIGEVLAVESPFTATIGEAHLYHCHECFELCYNPVPCPRCTQTLYCGEECKKNAWAKYHKDECPILLSLRKLVGRNKSFLLGVKMAFLNKDESADEVFNLALNMDEKDHSELLGTAMTAGFIFDLVKRRTGRFQGHEQAERAFKDSLLTYLKISVVQAAGVDELCPDDEQGQVQETMACAIYPFYGLFSHGCCPNVFAHHHGLKRVLRAIRSIKKGQECFVSFGPHYIEHSKEERQNRLLMQYHFKCKCKACREDWPQVDNQPYRPAMEDLMFMYEVSGGNVEVAKATVPVKLEKMRLLERLEPNADLTFQQKVLLHCFDVLGNKRVVL